MGKSTAKFKVGDRVRVDNPEYVLRIGYPKTPYDFREQANDLLYADEHNLIGFLNQHGFRNAVRSTNSLLHPLSYALLKDAGFGGPERSIHTEALPEWAGKIGVVQNIRYCKTGTYTPSSGQESEWEPAYLEDEKTHCLLGIIREDEFGSILTERCNVTLLTEDE